MQANVVPSIVHSDSGVNEVLLDVFSHHLEPDDGLFVYNSDDSYASCVAEFLCEVLQVNRARGSATVNKKPTDAVINPPSRVRWRWQKDPFLCLDVERVKKYGLLEIFAKTFENPDWTRRTIRDRARSAIVHDLSKPTLTPTQGFVYLFRSSSLYKIGKTVDVESRKKEIERDIGEPIEVVHFFATNDYSRAEGQLHLQFANVRRHGEWFDLSAIDVEAIMQIAELSFPDM